MKNDFDSGEGTVRPDEVAAAGALTPAQVGMLYDGLAGPAGVHVEQLVFHADDERPDPARTAARWSALAERHPALRSVCRWRGREVPRLEVLAAVAVRPEVEAHPGLSGPARAQTLAHFLRRDRARGIELESGPTWRLTLLVWGDRAHTLVWTFHHLFLDGPSHAALFRAFLADEPAPDADAAPAPSQDDHAHAVAAQRDDPAFAEAARRHCRALLGADSGPPPLGWADAWPPRPASGWAVSTESAADAPPALIRGGVPADTLARLHALCAAAGVTLSAAVHAAWGLALARWSGRADVVFGTVRSGRHLLPGADRTVGCLINTVPLRVSVGPGLALGELLRQVRQTLQGLRPFEHVALADVRRWCDLNATAELTDATLLFEPAPLTQRLRDRLGPHRRVELHEQTSAALSLMAYVDDGLDLRLEHDPQRVDALVAPRLLASVARLLAAMADATPATPLAALGALDDRDRATLARWSTPDAPLDVTPDAAPDATPACVLALIERQARATPRAPALRCAASGAALTREALDRAARRLSTALTARGVGPSDVVALCLPRGPGFVSALLAVMKSGAAWLPIDPRYPAALARHMLTDSRARLVITEPSPPAALAGVDSVAYDTLLAEADPAPATAAPAALSHPLDRPAYVIYTSGSTGQPKGVVVSHRALAGHARAVVQAYGLGERDRVLQFASLSFDVSIEEILPTLAAGAELVLRDDAAAESVSGFLRLVREQGITVLNLPTAFWHTCAEQMHLGAQRLPDAVRRLVVGGEKASRRELDLWRRSHPGLRWVNAYGPTEATISCTAFDLPAHAPLPPGADVPIGRPLGHARIAVLAPDGSLAPPGARGALCLGGPGLADGYLGLPDLTAERFPPAHGPAIDPLLAAWGWTRLYRTGDDARWDDAGQLRFLGRQDREVKVRGFRVDLRAVEHALERLPAVAEALVRLDRPGEPAARLVAWVLPAPGEHPSPRALEAELARALPAHMRPAIRLVSAWPTTPGGKIDPAQLPAHAPERAIDAVSDAAPNAGSADSTPADVRRLAAVFARVLRRDHVAPDDSFFDLGGHSLLALSLMARIEAEFGLPVPIGLLKTHPTPACLLAALRAAPPGQRPRHLVPLQADGAGVPLYAIHGLGERERLFRPLARALGTDRPVFGLTVGYVDFADEALSVEALAALYLRDIQLHRPTGPIALAGLSHSGYVAFELAQQLARAGRPVAQLVLFDSQGPGGRPFLQGRLARLRAHATELRAQGLDYVLHRVVHRLTDRGGLAARLGFLLARAVGNTARLEFDHPADAHFVHRLDGAVATYRPAPYAGPVTIFYPLDDAFLDRPAAERNALGWRGVCTGPIDLIPVPGGHLSMLSEPHVAAIAAHLSGQGGRAEPGR